MYPIFVFLCLPIKEISPRCYFCHANGTNSLLLHFKYSFNPKVKTCYCFYTLTMTSSILFYDVHYFFILCKSKNFHHRPTVYPILQSWDEEDQFTCYNCLFNLATEPRAGFFHMRLTIHTIDVQPYNVNQKQLDHQHTPDRNRREKLIILQKCTVGNCRKPHAGNWSHFLATLLTRKHQVQARLLLG